MTAHTDHPLVRDYLDRLAEAAQVLPDRGSELVADISGHLREALSDDAGEADVRTVLDRLGSPLELVAAAGGPTAAEPPVEARRGGRETLALVLLVGAQLMFVVWFVAVPMWVVGLVLMSASAAWTGREKLLGLLALGTGLPVVFLTMASTAGVTYQECSGGGVESGVTADGVVTTTPMGATCTSTGGIPGWVSMLAFALLVAYLALQAWTVWRLTRRR